MSFRDNLQHLRATRNMTQEQLAMLVGVSRQSVTKWEAEKAYPEMDKLLAICQIFDCTLDELVRGDLTSRGPDPAQQFPQGAPSDICGYDEHTLKFARRIALGVFCIIFGIGLGVVLDQFVAGVAGLPSGAASTVVFFAGLIAGLLLIIPAGVERSSFTKLHPYVQDFYTSEDKARAAKRGGYGIAIGIALILVGIILVAVFETEWMNGVFLMIIAAGVGCIVHAGISMSRTDVNAYNDQVLAEMSDEEVAEVLSGLDESEAAARIAKRRVNKRIGALCGIIMLAATAIALIILFGGMFGFGPFGAGEVAFFWVPWPIGGICCGIVAIALNAFHRP